MTTREKPACPQLTFDWAEKRWRDPLSGAEVVRVSPPRKRHYRNNYFRINLFTWDGRYLVMAEASEIQNGTLAGDTRLVARDLLTGAVRDLGTVPPVTQPKRIGLCHQGYDTCMWAVARYSHKVNVLDYSRPYDMGIIQIDLDTGSRRAIRPSQRLNQIYEPSFDASEQFIYTPWWQEKWELRESMDPDDFRAMLAAQPGHQEMIRIHLDSGEVESLFAVSTWWMGHPNPHPSDPDLFMCCQECCGENQNSRWGAAVEHERVRVMDLRSRRWIHKGWAQPLYGSHEHWAPFAPRIWTHMGGGGHLIVRKTLTRPDTPAYMWHCQADEGLSTHVMISPDETFLVGDGTNADQFSYHEEDCGIVAQVAAAQGMQNASWARRVARPSPGEIVWKFELPEQSIFDPAVHSGPDGMIRLLQDLGQHPEQAVRSVPICRFRALTRTLLKGGHRLESNAHVTPDARWVVFQSSGDDDRFEVWAARVPDRERHGRLGEM